MQPAHESTPLYRLGNFEILNAIGAGGMGVVYRARDVNLDRIVALKVLRDDLRSERHIVARFQREAEACAALNHPGIVHIYGVGKAAEVPYMAMELIEGRSLGEWLREHGAMPWQQALKVVRQVAEALGVAHEAQIIHRDIKPGNILIDKQGNATVTDFGIAKVLTAATKLTMDGARLGTPQYMSPERREDRPVTPASDFYSLGVVLFQMLTGKTPFDKTPHEVHPLSLPGATPRRLHEVMPEAPELLDRLVAWLLEANPRHRPQDSAALIAFIDGIVAREAGDATALEALTPTPLPPGRLVEEDTTTLSPVERRDKREVVAGVTRTRGISRKGWLLHGALALAIICCGYTLGLVLGDRQIAWPMPPVMDEAVWENPAGHFQPLRQETSAIQVTAAPGPGWSVTAIFPSPLGAALRYRAEDGRVGLSHFAFQTDTPSSLLPPGASKADILAAYSGAAPSEGLVLCGGPEGAWLYRGTGAWMRISRIGVVAAAFSPQGNTLALAQPVSSGQYRVVIAQVHAAWDHSIVLESSDTISALAFSPDGAVLWVETKTQRGSHRVVSRALQGDAADMATPLDADFRLLASAAGDKSAIVVQGIDLHYLDGTGLLALPPGRHPALDEAGQRYFYVAEDRAGRPQVWAASLQGHEEAQQWTHFEAGIAGPLGMSASSRRLIAALLDGSFAVIALDAAYP